VLVLDHHKTAQEELKHSAPFVVGTSNFYDASGWKLAENDNWFHFQQCVIQDTCEGVPGTIYVVFDMERSGAGLAWDFFFSKEPRPGFIDLVEDRDLWRFSALATKHFHAGNSDLPLTYEARKSQYDRLDCLVSNPDSASQAQALAELKRLITRGEAVLGYHDKLVDDLVGKRVKMRLTMPDGHAWDIYAVCHPLMAMVSDVGEKLCAYGPFGASYWYDPDRKVWQFSLRSRGDIDVSDIAKAFGGGGHKGAAGFAVQALDGMLAPLDV
jgi:uncharacterized protein